MQWEAIGPLLNFATIIFAAGALAYSVKNLAARMEGIEVEMKQIVAILVVQGRHEERMNAMDERLLAQGKRLDEFVKAQLDAQERMARLVESTISRVNAIADRNLRHEDDGH